MNTVEPDNIALKGYTKIFIYVNQNTDLLVFNKAPYTQ